MTLSVEHASSLNLATLSIAEREAIESHKADCLRRWSLAKEHASLIYLGLKSNRGRMWAERELLSKPDIQQETRNQLNAMLKAKK